MNKFETTDEIMLKQQEIFDTLTVAQFWQDKYKKAVYELNRMLYEGVIEDNRACPLAPVLVHDEDELD